LLVDLFFFPGFCFRVLCGKQTKEEEEEEEFATKQKGG
jgi:hypothetical protein